VALIQISPIPEHSYRSRVGRPPKHDWEEGLLFAEKLFTERGDFADSQNQMAGWKTEADFARAIIAHMSRLNNGIEPPFSTAKALVSKFINDKRSIRK
jgi:hypothetical protein